ncbi:hypothetical protein ACFWNC_06750 [Streptomyces sp. NPDC058369]|uniref:hypothetical protein n=1 Tax=unclassified Streptomyces TaxID=2593676 RepID=UPI002259C5E5|nr:hypothetical protein [Streptomyces sp. NBC_01789]MCX4451316.1 hypothetical protein [Streptomyces sp. NBC_01789]
MSTYAFPQDLRDTQLALHRTRAAYDEYAKSLPWSAEPLPGWETDDSRSPGTAPPSPTAPVTPGVVAARMALKHAHEEQSGTEAG